MDNLEHDEDLHQFQRLRYIDKEIRTKGFVTTSEIIDVGNVTTKQVCNDISFMRNKLKVPIVSKKIKDPLLVQEHGKKNNSAFFSAYVYDDFFSGIEFGRENVSINFPFIKSLLKTNGYIPVRDHNVHLIESICTILESPIYDGFENYIQYINSGIEECNTKYFAEILQAIDKKLRIEIQYVSTSHEGENLKDRKIEPLRLVYYEGAWFLISICTVKKAYRIFRLSLIQSIKYTDEKFVPVNKEVIDKYCNDGFGIFKGQPGTKESYVFIRFYNDAIRQVKFKKFHPAEIFSYVSNDAAPYLECKVPVKQYDEIISKVLGFGSDAEVISPAEARLMWINTIKDMAKKYN